MNSKESSINKKKIIVELIGGTGNQLFQLLACYRLAKIYNRNPFFTIRLLDGNRNFETGIVAKELKIEYIASHEIKNLSLLKENEFIHPAYFSYYPEKNFLPNEDIILSGYFQNYRIHDDYSVKKIKNLTRKIYKKFDFQKEDYIAIHTRELQASNTQKPLKGIDNLNIKYYERALEIIEKKISIKNENIKNIYLFTDMFKDTTYSKIIPKITKLLKNKKYNLILGDKLCSTAWESIVIMSQAKYVVASNSTFSWWGGYLSNTNVICPIFSLWDTRLLTPENWMQVNDGNLSPVSWHRENIYKKNQIKFSYRKDTKLFFRKIKHVFFFYIFKRVYPMINKKINLMVRNLLS